MFASWSSPWLPGILVIALVPVAAPQDCPIVHAARPIVGSVTQVSRDKGRILVDVRGKSRWLSLDKVRVYTADGKLLSRASARRRLRIGTKVLVSIDGRKVDPRYLRDIDRSI